MDMVAYYIDVTTSLSDSKCLFLNIILQSLLLYRYIEFSCVALYINTWFLLL